MQNIVVGTDGSKHAEAALKWAARHAKLMNGSLTVVHAWQYPYASIDVTAMAPFTPEGFSEEAHKLVDRVVADLKADGVPAIGVAREGGAAAVLLAEAEHADLLVVGARGHGGFAGLLLGSVATQCSRHPRCPTVIVPAEENDR